MHYQQGPEVSRDAISLLDLADLELLDMSALAGNDLWVESLPDQVSAGCCWTSAGCFTSLGTFGSCASTSTSASTASCAC